MGFAENVNPLSNLAPILPAPVQVQPPKQRETNERWTMGRDTQLPILGL
jgi:hypothetical protein